MSIPITPIAIAPEIEQQVQSPPYPELHFGAYDPGNPAGCHISLAWRPYHPEWGNDIRAIAEMLGGLGHAIEAGYNHAVEFVMSLGLGSVTLGPFQPLWDGLRSIYSQLQSFINNPLTYAWRCARNVYIGYGGDHKTVYRGTVFFKALLGALKKLANSENSLTFVKVAFGISFDKIEEIVDHVANYYRRQQLIDPADAVDAYLTGGITWHEYIHTMRCHSMPPKVVSAKIVAGMARIDESEVFKLWRRHNRNVGYLYKLLRPYKYNDANQIVDKVEASKYFPDIQTALRWVKRQYFDANKFGRGEMLAELAADPDAKDMFAVSGVEPVQYRDIEGHLQTLRPDEAMWMDTYRDIDSQTAMEMLHKMRPGRMARFALPGLAAAQVEQMAVTVPVVQQVLKEESVNPLWRNALIANSYQIVNARQVKQVYDSGAIGPKLYIFGFTKPDGTNPVPVGKAEREMVELFRDNGYTELDANEIAYEIAYSLYEQEEKPKLAKLKTQVCDQLTAGILTETEATAMLTHPLIPPGDIEFLLRTCRTDHRMKRLKMAVASVHRRFVRGELSENGVRAILAQAGVLPGWITLELQVWRLEIEARGKEVRGKELCSWMSRGLVSKEEYLFRMVNLGYSPEDAVRALRYCEMGILAQSAKDREKALRARVRDQEKLAALRKAECKRRKDCIKAAASSATKGFSEGNLRKWYKLGIITDQDIRDALTLEGWTKDPIDLFIEEVKKAAAAATSKSKPKPKDKGDSTNEESNTSDEADTQQNGKGDVSKGQSQSDA